MLKAPKNTKFKSPHLHLSNKGIKGYKKTQNAIVIKTKESHLMTPQQREYVDVSFKTCKREYGKLNIRFSRIYRLLKNITNAYG